MEKHTFFCIDAHTCGNPCRVVTSGAPRLQGQTMSERRRDFLEHFDWIRRALMFEPRGHDLMSGCFLYPATREDCDFALLFIETSGCLPMCGHDTIGAITVAIEHGLVQPRTPGVVNVDTPAGVVTAHYALESGSVRSVRFSNVASFLHSADLTLDVPGLGEIMLDVSYGGNFYAIIDPQKNYGGLDGFPVSKILELSPIVRKMLNERFDFVHPEDASIRNVSHVMWCGAPTHPEADRKNAVFFGDRGIDRSPCGTGTSARMAQLVAKGELACGSKFVHESIIGSLFTGHVESLAKAGGFNAIIPSIEGTAHVTGFNTLFVNDSDPYRNGFQVI